MRSVERARTSWPSAQSARSGPGRPTPPPGPEPAPTRPSRGRRAAVVGPHRGRPAGSDHLHVEVSFGDRSHAERVLWTFGDTVEVLAPASLRDAIAGRAAAVAALYT